VFTWPHLDKGKLGEILVSYTNLRGLVGITVLSSAILFHA